MSGYDESEIPAASIDGVDLHRIEQVSAADAAELRQLGKDLNEPDFTDARFIRLVELLLKHGEKQLAEDLLRGNVIDEGDELHAAYRRLFGTVADEELESQIAHFAGQFRVTLENTGESNGFLCPVYVSRPIPGEHDSSRTPVELVEGDLRAFLAGQCQLEFRYESTGSTADLVSIEPNRERPSAPGPESRPEYAIPLIWRSGMWHLEEEEEEAEQSLDDD